MKTEHIEKFTSNPLQQRFKEWTTAEFGIKNPRVCYYTDGEPYIAEYEIPFSAFLAQAINN